MTEQERAQAALCELTQAVGLLDEAEPGTLARWSPLLMVLERWLDGERFRVWTREGRDARWVVVEFDGEVTGRG